MTDRPRVPMPFGQGLDRFTGVMTEDPASFQDLRNVVLFEGKAQARRGLTSAGTLVNLASAAMTDVLRVFPFRAQQQLLLVGWTASDGKVFVFKAASTGTAPVVVDDTDAHSTWFTAQGAVGRPVVTMAESYGKVFLAHYYHPYKPSSTILRGVTRYYDPIAGAGSKLVTLNKDLGGGAEDIAFAGVTRHLAYLVGWGYGNKSTPDRAEIVRVSMPGDPTDWKPEHYFIVGARGDPVVCCASVGAVLKVFKESETYDIVGYDRTNFGVGNQAADRFGQAGPMLGVLVGGTYYFWSLSGPRMTDGGASVDLAPPLDLGAPSPTDLVASGEYLYGFTAYDPEFYRVLFLFPSETEGTTRAYVLHVRDPRKLRWSYDVYGRRLTCATVFLSAGASAPVGYPDGDSTSPIAITSTAATTRHVNHSNQGDETVEVWMRVNPAGAWSMEAEAPVSGVGDTQSIPVTGLTPDTLYDVARRYRKNGLYNAGAENTADPTAWPAASRDQVTTLNTVAAPTSFAAGDQVGPYLYGGKYYCDQPFTWDNPSGYPWQLYMSTTTDINDGIDQGSGSSGTGMTLTRGKDTHTDYYFFLKFTVPLSDWTSPALGPIRFDGLA